ncbi:hypothetical protein B296_00001511 [Ensete ventricosum]|uniref:Uncharacterized protein n=1 Tax=Ensete ventricosum TaxID=4639 RepID=A0A427AFD3_ENSVE|nr:hypothetical protein B296_00001511 [Ensete ventricosum]
MQQWCGKRRNSGERIATTWSCDCDNELEIVTLGKGRRAVGAGIRHLWEEKEEGSDESPASVVVSSGSMVNGYRKQWRSTATWLIVQAVSKEKGRWQREDGSYREEATLGHMTATIRADDRGLCVAVEVEMAARDRCGRGRRSNDSCDSSYVDYRR